MMRFFICLFQLLAILEFVNAACETKYTPCNDHAGTDGEITSWFLDRHQLECGADKVMELVKLETDCGNDKYRYRYSCCDVGTGLEKITKKTDCNDDGEGEMKWLDRHHINCSPENGAIYKFKLVRCAGETKFLYEYGCVKLTKPMSNCKEYRTNSDLDTNPRFLDRHTVSCPTGKIMTEFRYHRCSAAEETEYFDYKFTCCSATQETCKVTKIEVIDNNIQVTETGFRVVGVATAASCDPSPKSVSVSTAISVSETVGVTVENSEEFSFDATVDVEYTAGIGVKVNAGRSSTVGSTTGFSTTTGRETSVTGTAAKGLEIELQDRAVAMIYAVSKQYNIDQSNVQARLTLKCDDGSIKTVVKTISLKSQNYGHTHFEDINGKFASRADCTTAKLQCIRNLRSSDLFTGNGTKLQNDFENCL